MRVSGTRFRPAFRVLLMCIVVVLAAPARDAAPQSQPSDPRVIERPEWSIGDWWELRNADEQWRVTVIAKRGDGYTLARSKANERVEDSRGRTTYLTDIDGWTTENVDASGKKTPGSDKREWVKFPLHVGSRWFFSILTTVVGRPKTDLRMMDYDCRAERWEPIDVGGRSIQALRIAYAQRERSVAGYGLAITGWYAPEAKRLVRLKSDYAGGPSIEMVAFQVRSGDVPTTVTAAPSSTPAPPATTLDLKGPPPTIAVREPSTGQIFRDAQGSVRVEIVSRYRVTALTTKQPGGVSQVFSPPATAAPGQPWSVEVKLPLAEGNNPVELEVRDEHGGTTKQTVTLRRETPPPAPAPKLPVIAAPPLVAAAPPPPAQAASPAIALNYPPADLKVERAEIVVVGLVTANAGVARVQMTVNGADVTTTGDPKSASRGVPVRATVKLVPGENVIEVTATDKAGNIAQIVRTVTRSVPAAAVATASRFAVIIGIGEYENRTIPRLRYAARDAEAMQHVLVGQAGFKKENVLLLTDRTTQKPTLRNIKSALGTFLARSARKDDTVLVFFAGHGAPEVDPRGLERDGLAKYLIPSDADPSDLYATALSMDEIQTIFGRIEAERIVMFVDSCYSGAAGGRTFTSMRLHTRALSLDDLFLDRLTRAKGRAIITASRPSEVSLELAELGHGLFTYFLVEGLKGAADADRDGVVTLQEVYTYVEQQVSRKARAVGGNQHPVLKGELEGLLPLTVLQAR